MGILIFFLFPIALLAAASLLGLMAVALFSPKNSTDLWGEDRQMLATWLAPGMPVVAAATVLLPRIEEFKKSYGEFLGFLWVWALALASNGTTNPIGICS